MITPHGDLEILTGSILIGRLPECDVCLDDNLVSRMHARISVQNGSVVVEDLHSTNGVYVNGSRVAHSTAMREGDRILFGTTELSMFESRDSSLMRIKAARPISSSPTPQRPAPSPNKQTTPQGAPYQRKQSKQTLPVTPNKTPMQTEPPARQRPPARVNHDVPSTARADALKMIGGLADRLAATGNLQEASQVLSGHLRRILKGANAGLAVPADVAASAAHHALTLARWTKLPLWADYVVELHLSARLVMSTATLAAYEDVVTKVEDFDRMLLGYYVEGLKDRQDQLDMDERKRLERLKLLSRLAGS
ncbi:MAG TPA: FHA domain-containing protein [Polyangiaceae bacterium]|nr:FHA domain-containing protein [Polyangiaceae bacterium]